MLPTVNHVLYSSFLTQHQNQLRDDTLQRAFQSFGKLVHPEPGWKSPQ